MGVNSELNDNPTELEHDLVFVKYSETPITCEVGFAVPKRLTYDSSKVLGVLRIQLYLYCEYISNTSLNHLR